jgi:hypothetical protein
MWYHVVIEDGGHVPNIRAYAITARFYTDASVRLIAYIK